MTLYKSLISAIANGLLPDDKSLDTGIADKAARVYGSYAAYEQAVGRLAPDQRQRFEQAGIVLQPKQIEFALAARAADSMERPDEIATGGARGGGKSYSVFTQLAVDDCQRFPGLKVLYLRKTAKAGKEQLRDLVQAVLSKVNCEPTISQISYPNGSRIVIGGYKDDTEALKYQGIEFDILAIEELTQLSEHTYKTLRLSARSSKGFRPRQYLTFNPLGVGHQWVKKRFVDPYRQGIRGATQFIPATVDDNALVNVEYRRNLEELTGAELRAYRYGDWDVASGQYFETWNYEHHTLQPLDRIPPDWTVWAAMDVGYSHWNMVYFGAQDTFGNHYVFHEVAHRKAHPPQIAPDIHSALAKYGININRLLFFTVGTDAFRLTAGQSETLASQYQVYHIQLAAADMSAGSRIAGWQLISRLLGNPIEGKASQLYITRNCTRLIDSLPYAERDPRNPEDVRKWDTDEQGNGGDDPLDAIRYGLRAMSLYVGHEGAVSHDEWRGLG